MKRTRLRQIESREARPGAIDALALPVDVAMERRHRLAGVGLRNLHRELEQLGYDCEDGKPNRGEMLTTLGLGHEI